jgi:phosphoglycolate phosphatase
LCFLLNHSFYANWPEFRKTRRINFSCEFDPRCVTANKAWPYYNEWFMVAPNFSSVRALIFDLDGTLIDSQRDLILSVNAMLLEMGREELHVDTISGYIGHGAPQLVGKALGERATGEEREHALKFFLTHYEDHKMDNTCAYPGVAEALERLFPYPMAILTNKPVRVSVRILEGLGLAKYFRAVYGGNSFETKKPDPLGANTILREFAASPNEAIVIGDSEVDVQTARNAGTLAAAVNYGFGTHDRAAYPADIYLDRLADLVPLLGKSGK